jgi:hypothetical protein
MKPSGDDFLADTRFTEDKHGRVRPCDGANLRPQCGNGWTVPEQQWAIGRHRQQMIESNTLRTGDVIRISTRPPAAKSAKSGRH